MIDLTNIRPLHAILGAGWENEDVMQLFEPDVRAQLLVEETRAQRSALTAALNAVAHAMMPRRKTRGWYKLGQMRAFYQERQVACVGRTNRAQLDCLFAEAAAPQAATPAPQAPQAPRGPLYRYPLPTFSGIAYGEPVTDYNAGQQCHACPYLAACREIVTPRDGLALCEIALECELIPESVYVRQG